MPGPGYYPVKTFVESIKTDSKVFTLAKKCHYAYRKLIVDNEFIAMNYPSLPGPGYYN